MGFLYKGKITHNYMTENRVTISIHIELGCPSSIMHIYISGNTLLPVLQLLHVLLEALPLVCMKYTARDESQVANLAH